MKTYILLAVICLFGCTFLWKEGNKINEENFRDIYGTVHKKIGEVRSYHKSTNVYIDFIFVIKDRDTNEYYSLNVTPVTFSTKEEGDSVTFKHINKSKIGEPTNDWEFVFFFLSILCGLAAVVSMGIVIDNFSDKK